MNCPALQCRALTRLLNAPESEADIWEDWGLHALTEGEGLEEYTAEQFAKAEEQPGDDFFSMLNQVEFRGGTHAGGEGESRM